MKILIDMNLTPRWCDTFHAEGWSAAHWSEVGDPDAADRQIMEWALAHGYLVFTHDLDFGAILAATQLHGPSVIQVRVQDPLPDRVGSMVLQVLKTHERSLDEGALLIVEEDRSRVRILPLPR